MLSKMLLLLFTTCVIRLDCVCNVTRYDKLNSWPLTNHLLLYVTCSVVEVLLAKCYELFDARIILKACKMNVKWEFVDLTTAHDFTHFKRKYMG